MALSPCNTCRRHIRADADCPFCGASRARTTLGHWGAALLAVTLPLGIGCDSKDPTSAPAATKPDTPEKPAETPLENPPEPEAPEKPARPDADAKPPTPEPPVADTPEPAPTPAKPDENTKPEGDTPIEPEVRPARKYGAPPRPRPKYGAPPKPRPLESDASKMKKHPGGDKPR